jgi:putative transposase
MPRISRAVAVGYPHHITQRGNYRQSVFKKDEDYSQYLEWLKEYCQKHSLKIWAYCLMSNHVHFIGVPMEEDSLARTFNTLHMRYSQYFNKRGKEKGHLWQGRFYSCILDEQHMYAAIRYIENNPVRANIVEKPYDYKWSSAKAHVYRRKDTVLSHDCHLEKGINNWLAYLLEKDERAVIDNIIQNTKTGRPCGDDSFVNRIEIILGRRLTAFPKGRPRKRNK